MGSQQTIKPSGLTTIPQNYPTTPTPGKLEILWDANSTSLYHRLSPFAEYNTSLIGGFTTQPYYYTYIDESGRGLNSLKKYESRGFPLGSAPIDVIRVSKFLASGNGIIFLGKQFLLQTGNPYNERRIYNPTSPIVAAGMGLALGSIRPERSFDTSAGLLGIASSLIGDAIPNAIFGEPKVNKPSGTAPDALTGGPLVNTGGKGLLRAGDANRGRAHLEKAWVQTGKQNFSFGSVIKNIVTSLFANFIPAVQEGISQKSDEGAYGLMIGGGNPRFDYIGDSTTIRFGQRWVGGSNTMRKSGQYPVLSARYFTTYTNGFSKTNEFRSGLGFPLNSTIPGVENGEVGYDINESSVEKNPGVRYGDAIGSTINQAAPYKNSDIMYQYSIYADPNQSFPTKDPEVGKDAEDTTNRIKSLHTIKNPYNKSTGSKSTLDGETGPSDIITENNNYVDPSYNISVKDVYTKDPESTKVKKTSIAHSYSSSYKYSDVKGEAISTREGEFDTNSDIMDQYRLYSDPKYVKPGLGFRTKNPDSNKFEKIKRNLTDTLDKIKKASQGLYSVNIMRDESTVIRSGGAQTYGYDRLFNTVTNETVSPMNYPLGVLQDYREVTVVDETIKQSGNSSYKMPTNGTFDAINTLTVIPANSLKENKFQFLELKGWETEQWNPYKSDIIAFYFYDVVNENYIPFRATITGLVENGNASWEEIPFIGRADKVYSYGGFNRNVNFTFKVVISSIAELAPTWQRINYLTTLIKPANYTTATVNISGNSVMNRFMIPPMVMLTIGDFYKDQPVLIQSVTTIIPEDSSWETLNDSNSVVWNYLAKYIESPNVKYGQMPRTIEISVGLILLEKERAVVGGANFGHAPRTEDYSKDNLNTIPNPGGFSTFHKSLVVNVIKQSPTIVKATATTPASEEFDRDIPASEPPPEFHHYEPQPSPVLVPQTNGPTSDFGDRDIPASGPPQISPKLTPPVIPNPSIPANNPRTIT